MKKVIVDGEKLSIENLIDVARNFAKVELSKKSITKIKKSRAIVEKLVKKDEPVYGLTTGFGSLCNVSIPPEDTARLQKNLIMSHSVGVGKPFSEEVVRGAMLLRANTLAKGVSGIRLILVETLLKMLNKRIYPFVPEKGSVGASGDLAPLSHMCLVLIGEGEAFYKGKKISGKEAMKKAGIKPLALTFKEGLAFNNGTPFMTANAALAVYDSENLFKNAEVAAAMSMEALKAKSDFLDPRIHSARPHKGQISSAKDFRKLLKGSKLINADKEKIQDSYCVRASPQVLGASLDAINYVKGIVQTEMNSATDNPLIFERAYSGANFHGQPLALAADFLSIALSEIGNIAERRINKMLDEHTSHGLPPFLVRKSGLNSGLMLPQYTAASLVSENKVLSHPSSVDSIPTCANQEDHVSMGGTAARKVREILYNVENIIAIELLCASQAVEERRLKSSPLIAKAIRIVRKKVPLVENDRILYPDMKNLWLLIREQSLAKLV